MSNSYRWYVVALLTVLSILNYADRAVVSAVLPLLRSGLGMSVAMLGVVNAAFLWPYAVGSPITGFFADRLPRVAVTVWSLVVWSLATLLSGLAANAGQMVLTRILLGVSQCAFMPAGLALMAEFHPEGRKALAISIPLAGCNLGIIVGGLIGGYCGDHFGWRPAFVILGLAGLLVAVLCLLTLRPLAAAAREREAGRRPAAAGRPRARFRDVFRVPSYIVILLESCSMSVYGWVFISWLPFFFHEAYGLNLTGSALAGTVAIQLAATAGYAFGGYFSDFFSGTRRERRMLLQGICYFSAAPFVLIFAFKVGVAAISLCVFIASIIRATGSVNDQVLVCEILPPGLRSTGLGLMNGVNIACGSVGVVLAGLLPRGIPLSAMFASMVVFFLLAAAIALVGYRRYLPRDLLRAA